MHSTTKVVAIIVTYNGISWVHKCIQSLLTATIPIDIVVVDNASTDATVSYIKNNFSTVTLIASPQNLGFGKANNIGFNWAIKKNAEYVFLLNQDAWVENNTVEKLIVVAQKNPQFAIVSPFHLSYDGLKTETYFNDFVLNHYTKDYINDVEKNSLKQTYTSQFIHAACWLLPIHTIKNIGGFDPLFFHYGEDNDFVQRVQFKKLQVGLVLNTNVYHYGTNEGLQNSDGNSRFLANQIVLQLKNPSASLGGALVLFFKQYYQLKKSAVVDLPLLAAYKFNFKQLASIIRSRKQQLKQGAYLNN